MAEIKNRVKINHDYFALTPRWENIKYFVRQGCLFSHIVDRVKWWYFPKHFLVPDFPTHIDIEASSACQMRCPMCKTTEMTNSGIDFAGFMDEGLYRKIIDECADSSLYSIKLSWRGEPLLNPKIVEMVAYAKEKGIKDMAFLTNGERLNKELAERLVMAGLDWISVSFDGMGEVYNRVRKPAVFEEMVDKITYMRRYRDKLGLKRPLIRVQSVHSAIRGFEVKFLELWDGIADRVNFIADQKRSIKPTDYRHDPFYVCPSPWQRMCIAWDGKVAQCYGDYMMGNVLGDVSSQSLRRIWHGERFRELRRLMKNSRRLATKPCQTCSDGGITEEEEVIVNGRRIRAARYVHQDIDVTMLNENYPEKKS